MDTEQRIYAILGLVIALVSCVATILALPWIQTWFPTSEPAILSPSVTQDPPPSAQQDIVEQPTPTTQPRLAESGTGLECEATVFSPNGATTVNVVYLLPSRSANKLQALGIGTTVQVTEFKQEGSDLWYRLIDLDGRFLGWVLSEYLRFVTPCELDN